MKKYSRNIGIAFSAVVIAANTQITTLSYALESNINQNKIEINEQESVEQNSKYEEHEIAQVKNRRELAEALKDTSIKMVDIKSDITLTGYDESDLNYENYYELLVKGSSKEINGNGHKISEKLWSRGFLYLYTDVKINNLNMDNIYIRVREDVNLDITNSTELKDIVIHGNEILLDNVNASNLELSSYGDLIINSSKLNSAQIKFWDNKGGGLLKISNTELINNRNVDIGYGKEVLIESYVGDLELENVKITNPGKHAIYIEGSDESNRKINIKGTLEINNAKEEAILLKKTDKSNKAKPIDMYIDGDITQKGDTYTMKVEKDGVYANVHYDENKLEKLTKKRLDSYYSVKNREGNKPSLTTHYIVGDDRYDTAKNASEDLWKESENIVIVNGSSLSDAVSVIPFAKYKDAPILLVGKNSAYAQFDFITYETMKEMKRLNPKNIYVIGGEDAISESRINEIDEYMNFKVNIERIGGNNRYETSLEIAKRLGDVSEIAVVNGMTGISDAVSIAPYAADKKIPIVLASPMEGTDIFDEYIKDKNIKKSYVIGGESAISNEIENKLPNPERLGGIDRNETNASILEKFYSNVELDNIFVCKDGIQNQDYLIDALIVGPIAAGENSPVVIVGNDLNDKQAEILYKKKPKEITQVGGNGNENVFNKLINIFKNQ